jgi:hypothetical protein
MPTLRRPAYMGPEQLHAQIVAIRRRHDAARAAAIQRIERMREPLLTSLR